MLKHLDALTRLATLLATFVWIGLLSYLGLMSTAPRAPFLGQEVGSHLGHYVFHFVLSALVYLLASPESSRARNGLRAVGLAVAVSTLLGLGIEGLQATIGDRNAQASDIVFNALGAITGSVTLFAINRLSTKREYISAAVVGTTAALTALVIVGGPYTGSTGSTGSCQEDLFRSVVAPFDATPIHAGLRERIALRSSAVKHRVRDGLQLLYDFEEGEGHVVLDVSGVGAPLDLQVVSVTSTTWVPGGLSIDSSTILGSTSDATELTRSIRATKEITMEAWLKPANTVQAGPARIVTLSCDTSWRNFTLGQVADTYDVRLRTTETGRNGIPSLSSSPASLTTRLTHVAYTRDANGVARIYVDGVEESSAFVGGDVSNWDEKYRVALANEWSLDRAWLGEVYLVAIYNRALSDDEIGQNFEAGVKVVSQRVPVSGKPRLPTSPALSQPGAGHNRQVPTSLPTCFGPVPVNFFPAPAPWPSPMTL